ncbi:MAG: phage holin family protein [Chloroflexi bacterium]|nr:phage holin family protein [Chloroflexota bacterium]
MARENELGLLGRLVLRFIINTGALVISAYIVNSLAGGPAGSGDLQAVLARGPIAISDWQGALATSGVFGLVNALIRPLAACFSCLLQVLTLGLFTLVVNALMLLLTSALAGYLHIGFSVDGFGAAFFGAILISVVSTILTHLMR